MEPGTITSASPLMVRLYGSTTAIPALKIDAYTTPVIGDRVAVVRFDSQTLVVGKVV